MASSSPLKSGNIKAIDRSSVHRICSGQVVLTLATAVKELVENSIDAGATNIEVKVKEYGSELIEVSDNGSGVKPSDYQNLTLKHHTSKIGDFSDLPSINTFGFRGEALSSLCALSKMSIITCHEDSNVGDRLDYDHDGLIVRQTPIARQVGTTVLVENLFSTLPVRHKEFHKNLKKEFGKMIQLLTAYCLISTKKRITCINNSAKGKKTFLLSTNGDQTIRGNISCIYGPKQVSSLMEFNQKTASDSILEEFNIISTPTNDNYKIEGFLSPSIHGSGRSTADRQFFFINGRPCDLPKVAKVINDVYHSFNRHQFPFVCLNIELLKDNVDVNVTPDKRQIFISSEKALLAIIKTSILAMYEHQPSTLKHCSIDFPKEILYQILPIKTIIKFFLKKTPFFIPKETSVLSKLKRSCDDFSEAEAISPVIKNPRLCNDDDAHDEQDKGEVLNCNANSMNDSLGHNGIVSECDSPLGQGQQTIMEKDSLGTASQQRKMDNTHLINFTVTRPYKENGGMSKSIKKDSVLSQNSLFQNVTKFSRDSKMSYSFNSNSSCISDKNLVSSTRNLRKKQTFLSTSNKPDIQLIIQQHEQDLKTQFDVNLCQSSTSATDLDSVNQNATENGSTNSMDIATEKLAGCNDLVIVDEQQKKKRKCITLDFQLDHIKEHLKSKVSSDTDHSDENYRKFRAKINAKDAELELQKEISKDMFAKMEIIGQFNLGFIIAKYNEDLFIIDQHATDEKYNFEVLQRETVLETQKLLNPQTLELMADSETVLLDNLPVFERNGFKFTVSEKSKPGQRIQMVSAPVSQNWSFGKDDVDELIFMLSDNSGKMCRPSRVCQMFASRACRKSVMIGTSLSHQVMKKLVCHMGEIDQPWNCPHGRPTMRHLFNMNLLHFQ